MEFDPMRCTGGGDVLEQCTVEPLRMLRQHGLREVRKALKRTEQRALYLATEPPDQQTIDDLYTLRELRRWLKDLDRPTPTAGSPSS